MNGFTNNKSDEKLALNLTLSRRYVTNTVVNLSQVSAMRLIPKQCTTGLVQHRGCEEIHVKIHAIFQEYVTRLLICSIRRHPIKGLAWKLLLINMDYLLIIKAPVLISIAMYRSQVCLYKILSIHTFFAVLFLVNATCLCLCVFMCSCKCVIQYINVYTA